MNLLKVLSDTKAEHYLNKNGAKILFGMGITAGVLSVSFAIRDTTKAMKLIEKKKKEEEKSNLTKTETVKTVWKCYIPTATSLVFSILCLIASNNENIRRQIVLATAYRLSEAASKEYREKVIETIGEEGDKEIRDKIAKDKIKKNQPSENNIIITGKGDTLCYDTVLERYFKSDIEKIKRAENEVNRKILEEGSACLNDLYFYIGMSGVESVGYDLGWDFRDGLLDIYFSSQLTENYEPCLVLDYSVRPKKDFLK